MNLKIDCQGMAMYLTSSNKNKCVPCVPLCVPFLFNGTHVNMLNLKLFNRNVYHVYHYARARACENIFFKCIAFCLPFLLVLSFSILTRDINGTHGTHGTHALIYIALLCVPLLKMVHTMVHIKKTTRKIYSEVLNNV